MPPLRRRRSTLLDVMYVGGEEGGEEEPARVIVQDTAVCGWSQCLCYIGRVVLFGFIRYHG